MVASDEILKRVSDQYRRIRNTFRFILGNLNDFNKTTSDVGFIASSSLSYTEEDIKGWKKREDWPVWESEISASMRGELGLAYTELISPMIKAIQQLSAKVEELEVKISGSI